MKRWRRVVTYAGLLAMLALVGCAPLPGRTLDPVGRAVGGSTAGPPPARDQWLGRYEDSRGSGELALQVRRSGNGIEGVWQLRTGGVGVVTGTLVAGSSIVKFQLASQDASCFVLLEGAGELTPERWTATYAGRDCQGAIANGRFTLMKR